MRYSEIVEINGKIRFPIDIKLNGTPIKWVLVADDKIGYVVRFVTGDDGYPVLNESRDDLLTEMLFGKVEIIFSEND